MTDAQGVAPTGPPAMKWGRVIVGVIGLFVGMTLFFFGIRML